MSAPTPTTSEPIGTKETSAALEGVLRAVWRLVQGITLYGTDHPAVMNGAAEAAAASAIPGAASTDFPLLRISPEGFTAGGTPLAREAALVDLACLLHRLRVGMLSVPVRATPAAFLALGAALAAKRAGEQWTEQDSSTLSTGAASAIRLITVTYGALRSGGADGGVDLGAFDWNSLVATHCPGSGQASADEVALAIDQALKTRSGPNQASPASAPAGPSIAQQLAHTIKSADDPQRQAAVTRVSAVIERLTPDGRARLLAIDESRAAESLATVSDLCDSADAGDILVALERVGDPAKLVCNESVRLLTKIAMTARGDAGINGGLRHIVSRAAGAAGTHQLNSTLRSFQELMERSSADRFNPEDYERLLQQLGSAPATTASHQSLATIRARWKDPHLHSSHLLADLAESDLTSAPDAAGIYRRLHAAFGSIADSGGSALLLRATRAGQRFLRGVPVPDAAAAIEQFIQGLQSPEGLRRVLAGAPPGTAGGQCAVELITILGTQAISTALVLCAGESARSDVLALLSHPSVDTAGVLAQFIRTDLNVSVRLLRTRALPRRAQGMLAGILAANPDPDVSADAFASMHSCEPEWLLEHMGAALNHPREQVRVLGIDLSRRLTPAQRVSLLRPIVAGVVEAPIPLSVLSAAVQTLVDSGAEGRNVVIGLCGQLLRRPTSRRVDTVLNILDVLCARSIGPSSEPRRAGRLTLMAAMLRAALKGTRT